MHLVDDKMQGKMVVERYQCGNSETRQGGVEVKEAPKEIGWVPPDRTSTIQGIFYLGEILWDTDSMFEDMRSGAWPLGLPSLDSAAELAELLFQKRRVPWLGPLAPGSATGTRTHVAKESLQKIGRLICNDTERDSARRAVRWYTSSYDRRGESDGPGYRVGRIALKQGNSPVIEIWCPL